MLFVFLHMFCVWLFLFFDLVFSITLPPVPTLNPNGKIVSKLRFWVSFLVKDTRCFGGAKDCLFGWFVSFFKFCFLYVFGLHFLHQIGNKLLCRLIFFSQIWGFILCKESFRARNCRDIQIWFIFLRIRKLFLKLPVFFSKQVVNRQLFLICYFKIDLWVVSLHWKPSLLQFSPIICRIVSSRKFWIVSKTWISVLSLKVTTNKVSLETSCLKKNLSASAFQSNQ